MAYLFVSTRYSNSKVTGLSNSTTQKRTSPVWPNNVVRGFSIEEVQSSYKTLFCKIFTWLLSDEDGSTHLFVNVCNDKSMPYHFVKDGAIFFPLVGSIHWGVPLGRRAWISFKVDQTLSQSSLDTYPFLQIKVTYYSDLWTMPLVF